MFSLESLVGYKLSSFKNLEVDPKLDQHLILNNDLLTQMNIKASFDLNKRIVVTSHFIERLKILNSILNTKEKEIIHNCDTSKIPTSNYSSILLFKEDIKKDDLLDNDQKEYFDIISNIEPTYPMRKEKPIITSTSKSGITRILNIGDKIEYRNLPNIVGMDLSGNTYYGNTCLFSRIIQTPDTGDKCGVVKSFKGLDLPDLKDSSITNDNSLNINTKTIRSNEELLKHINSITNKEFK